MFSCKLSPDQLFIKTKEFTDHPIGIGGDPENDREIMRQFRFDLTVFPGDPDRDRKGWNDHRNAQFLPDHTPTDIFHQPESDMHIFHPAESRRYHVYRLSSLAHG